MKHVSNCFFFVSVYLRACDRFGSRKYSLITHNIVWADTRAERVVARFFGNEIVRLRCLLPVFRGWWFLLVWLENITIDLFNVTGWCHEINNELLKIDVMTQKYCKIDPSCYWFSIGTYGIAIYSLRATSEMYIWMSWERSPSIPLCKTNGSNAVALWRWIKALHQHPQ